jgi:predicted metal-dependent HD superfamily phosphohydrolase
MSRKETAVSLIVRWLAVAGESTAARAIGAELLARWSEPRRRYHTLDHLRAVLSAIDLLAHEAADPDAVRLAAWFHDAVYDGRPGWDEERSAQLAQRLLPRCGVPHERVIRIAALVRLTATHTPDDAAEGTVLGEADAADGAVLCDADLAVLAGPDYAAYARAVREEYRHVPDEPFRAGRAQILRRLMARPHLYRTPEGHRRWEAKARANMAAELTTLEAPR